MTPCKIHGKLPTLVYTCCVGAKGGRSSSPAKAAASRQNAEQARAAKAKKPP